VRLPLAASFVPFDIEGDAAAHVQVVVRVDSSWVVGCQPAAGCISGCGMGFSGRALCGGCCRAMGGQGWEGGIGQAGIGLHARDHSIDGLGFALAGVKRLFFGWGKLARLLTDSVTIRGCGWLSAGRCNR